MYARSKKGKVCEVGEHSPHWFRALRLVVIANLNISAKLQVPSLPSLTQNPC